ncbi:MAG: alkaline phosphatase family protein [Bradymonadaceae bacterium]
MVRFLAACSVLLLTACSDPEDPPVQTSDAGIDATPDIGDPVPDVVPLDDVSADADLDEDTLINECELEYVLPTGDSYALQITEFIEPRSIASLARGYLASVPPLLLFADGLTDGSSDDPVVLVGGVGERVSFGFDDTPETEHDVFAMHMGSLNATTCDYHVRLDGASQELVLRSTAEHVAIDLSGFSSATEGVHLRIDEVEFEGTFDEDLKHLNDVVLKGIISDEGIDILLEAARDIIPLSKEQAMGLLDPNDTGVVLVELRLKGRLVVVDGFLEAARDVDIEPRIEEPCCPEGSALGDPIYPYLIWQDQGIQDDERELFQLALTGLRADPLVTMVATAEKDPDTGEVRYSVYSGAAMAEGSVTYRRVAGVDGGPQTFEIISQTGLNPLAATDPYALGTYEEFLMVGLNPNDVTYAEKGYEAADDRVVFVPVEEMTYPFGYERLAHNFDDPRTGDLIVFPASYATGGFGTHGHLNSLQSRSPLFFSGPGVRSFEAAEQSEEATLGNGDPTLLVDGVARIVDIAPTIAAALGVARTTGVGPDGRFRDDVFLKWQDGRVLEEIFTDDALEKISNGEPVAERAIIIINDGLTNIEILYQALSTDPDFDIAAYRKLLHRGLALRYGSITNFPSNTYPSHNTLGTGAWAGHHGIIDNSFWLREVGAQVSPIRDLFETEYLLGSAHPNLPIETLHEAVIRTYGNLASDDNLTASINQPSTRGAEFASLERRLPEGFTLSEGADSVEFGGQTYVLPPADITDYAGVMDNGSLQTMARLFLDRHLAPETGLPVPRYTILNFGSTDTAGHAYGPHGNQERDVVISRVNERLAILLELLEYLDLLDTTLIVLTSDHGMELQDSSRMGWKTRALNTADIAYRHAGWYIYFKQLETDLVDNALTAGAEGALTLKAYDSDTRWGPELIGAIDVTIRVIEGGTAEDVRTNADGIATLEITVDAEADSVLLEFESDEWSPYRRRVALP